MNELIEYVKAENVKTLAWINEDPSNRWASLHSEDLEDWEARGIYNLNDFKRDELATYIYEAYKDAYGVKGRHYNFEEMSFEELEEEAKRISNAVSEEIERVKVLQNKNIEEFEARVKETSELLGNQDLEHIVYVIADAEGIRKEDIEFYGWETMEYDLDLPYGFIKKFLKG